MITMKERIQAAATAIKYSQEGHIEWRDHLKSHPDYPTKDVGDIQHHEKSIEKYQEILDLLEELMNDQTSN